MIRSNPKRILGYIVVVAVLYAAALGFAASSFDGEITESAIELVLGCSGLGIVMSAVGTLAPMLAHWKEYGSIYLLPNMLHTMLLGLIVYSAATDLW